MEGEIAQLVETWIKRYEAIEAQGPDAPYAVTSFWAYSTVDEICTDSPQQGLTLIKYILASTTNEFVLANLSAGPLETLLAHHGAEIITEVEHSAERDPRFRALLRGLFQNLMNDEIWGRVQKAAM